eukprot:NODE_189_length_2819_cov_22.178700_g172_i0.p1 GENE.NODE_189_length_2819_cov_22.178700_g172_i0~~NODE_189_length_2819_cov_22.178700_g172_i0.p1  ORF type:complete len:657 (-),score=160.52 NODE_189_length_2819_cov_22.178700_g172_i0:631-2601(-)
MPNAKKDLRAVEAELNEIRDAKGEAKTSAARGELQMMLEDYVEQCVEFGKTHAGNPKNARLFYQLGEVVVDEGGEFHQAWKSRKARLEQASVLYEHWAGLEQGLGNMELGNSLFSKAMMVMDAEDDDEEEEEEEDGEEDDGEGDQKVDVGAKAEPRGGSSSPSKASPSASSSSRKPAGAGGMTPTVVQVRGVQNGASSEASSDDEALVHALFEGGANGRKSRKPPREAEPPQQQKPPQPAPPRRVQSPVRQGSEADDDEHQRMVAMFEGAANGRKKRQKDPGGGRGVSSKSDSQRVNSEPAPRITSESPSDQNSSSRERTRQRRKRGPVDVDMIIDNESSEELPAGRSESRRAMSVSSISEPSPNDMQRVSLWWKELVLTRKKLESSPDDEDLLPHMQRKLEQFVERCVDLAALHMNPEGWAMAQAALDHASRLLDNDDFRDLWYDDSARMSRQALVDRTAATLQQRRRAVRTNSLSCSSIPNTQSSPVEAPLARAATTPAPPKQQSQKLSEASDLARMDSMERSPSPPRQRKPSLAPGLAKPRVSTGDSRKDLHRVELMLKALRLRKGKMDDGDLDNSQIAQLVAKVQELAELCLTLGRYYLQQQRHDEIHPFLDCAADVLESKGDFAELWIANPDLQQQLLGALQSLEQDASSS